MTQRRNRHIGFSLAELIVVMAIIALLTAILMPVVARVQRASRSTVCLAHLQQWGQSFQMYLSSNSGHSIPRGEPGPSGATYLMWWEALAPYNADIRGCLICPEATEPHPGPPDRGYHAYKAGSAHQAWWLVTYWAREPEWIIRGDYTGSYGVNAWAMSQDRAPNAVVRFPPAQAEHIPLFGDCREAYTNAPNGGEVILENLQGTGPMGPGVNNYCLDRHGMAVNLVFLDGHAEHVPLNQLWNLKWSETFKPHDVVLPNN
jgi:prepilin-type N-terminal cleavage/methylation domain-containing protein/prepilin-type processing-associated H-X9-DG protein